MLLFCDGMDHYSIGQVTTKWDSNNALLSTSAGRFGGGSITNDTNNAVRQISKNIAIGNSFVVGFAFKMASFPGSGTMSIVRFLDTSTIQTELRIDTTGRIGVYTNNALVGTVTVNAVTANIWHFIEWKVTIAASTGTNQCVVRVDNVEVLNLTSISTKTTGNTSANVVSICDKGFVTMQVYYDDFYVCNNSGSSNNDFLGDCRIETLYPSGAGTHTTFSLNGASSNWQAVSESPSDDDTSYVSSDTPGNIDNYAFTNPAGTINTVFAIQTVMRAKKDNAGVRTFSRVISISGTDYIGTAFSLGTDYSFFSEVIESDPSTSSPWTSTAINALVAGVKVIS